MLQNQRKISHQGVISEIVRDSVFVKIEQLSACSGCHAKNICNVSEKKEKIIEIKADAGNYKIGEKVLVVGSATMGLKAVIYTFVMPLMIMLICLLFTIRYMGKSEVFGVLTALGLLICYYGSLYLTRDIFKKKFTFELSKIENSES